MKFLVFRALWGMTGPFEQQLEQIAAAGYDGIDAFIGVSDLPPAQFAGRVAAHGLKHYMGAQIDRTDQLEPILNKLADYQPLKIGIQGGRDAMMPDEGCAFFEEALRVEQQIGIPVLHETHRGRLLFTPWQTAYYLQHFDTLKILADYSHWVNVCERLPDDQGAALALANRHAAHIHGRVGYEEGPQVPDPSAPEYTRHLAWHEAHWREIVKRRKAAGDEWISFTPEYGPPGYLHTLPHTNMPVADLWQVCLWAAQRAREQLGPVAEG